LIRLERGARSNTNRSIMSHGAFAVLYGQHLKYYIKDPEVTLGRETSEEHVDIDLGKEGKANTISRQQVFFFTKKNANMANSLGRVEFLWRSLFIYLFRDHSLSFLLSHVIFQTWSITFNKNNYVQENIPGTF
jgi:hypothetical protein